MKIQKEEFHQRLLDLRTERGLSQKAVAEQLKIPQQTYHGYETGARKITLTLLRTFAKFFDVSLDYLAGMTNERKTYQLPPDNVLAVKANRYPLISEMSNNEIEMEEKFFYFNVDYDMRADLCIRAKGDSMIGVRILNGDYVFIKRQAFVANGEIAAVIIDDDVLLRRFYTYPGRVELRPENPTYQVLNFENDDLDKIQIIGKAVAFYSVFVTNYQKLEGGGAHS